MFNKLGTTVHDKIYLLFAINQRENIAEIREIAGGKKIREITATSAVEKSSSLVQLYVTVVIMLRFFKDFIPKSLRTTADKPHCNLKGLSHEIDFKNFDKKLHNLA
jgi:hypothetical protein